MELPGLADWFASLVCFVNLVKLQIRQWGSQTELNRRYESDSHPWITPALVRCLFCLTGPMTMYIALKSPGL